MWQKILDFNVKKIHAIITEVIYLNWMVTGNISVETPKRKWNLSNWQEEITQPMITSQKFAKNCVLFHTKSKTTRITMTAINDACNDDPLYGYCNEW